MDRRKRIIAAIAFGIALVPLASRADQALEKDAQDANQWVLPMGSYSGIRHSKLTQITTGNASKLKVAWTMSTGTLRGQEGQPLVVGDMMYFESSYPNFVYAINLDNVGQIVWKFSPEQDKFSPSVACCDLVNKGVAYADGKILVTTLDTHVYALDAKTGNVVWVAQNGDPQLGQTMTMAPLVVHDKVIVGISGGEYGVRGFLSAYDLKSGKLVWKATNVGPDADILFDPAKTIDGATQQLAGKDSSLKTWNQDEWKLGGGTTWGWYTYDPQLNLVYYGSGNPGTWNPSQRAGDNKWSTTILARNPDTGVAAWAYQMTPHDAWDYDGINESVLTESVVDGATIPTLTHFDRNGFAYLIDRRNGKLLRANKFDSSVNWAKEIDLKSGRPVLNPDKMTKEDVNVKDICPAAQGAKNHQPASYDPKTKLFYVGTNHICMDYQAFSVKYRGGFPYVGATLSMFPADHGNIRGKLIAFDAVSGQTKWSVDEMFQVYSGPLTTDSGVLFYGTLDGWFKAVDQANGKVLYKFKAPSGIIGNPISYMHKGKQYVAVLTGVGGWAAIGLAEGLTKGTEGLGAVGLTTTLADYTNLGGTLMVFSLDRVLISECMGRQPAAEYTDGQATMTPAQAFNEEQRARWSGIDGEYWTSNQDRLDRTLAPTTGPLLAFAAPRVGSTVIDVGCGCGATTIELARAVGPSGRVIGIDISAPMLALAMERLGDFPNTTCLLGDAADLPLDDLGADLIVSRFGVMFFGDPVAAFANLRAGLATGGRLRFACWRPINENPWLQIPLHAVYEHAPRLPKPDPEEPGPFAFGDTVRVTRVLTAAGFAAPSFTPLDIQMDIAAGGTLEDAVMQSSAMGPAKRALADQSDDIRAAALGSIRRALTPYASAAGVHLPGAIWLVAADRPQ